MRAFVLTNLEPRAAGAAGTAGWGWRINMAAIARNLNEIEGFPYAAGDAAAASYPGQAFFIGGSDSSFIRTGHLPAIAGLFPHYTIAKIKNAGHWIHTEQPGHTLDLVSRFLDDTTEH
jgi:pimeloyl-ACP methyl ester carboxylesterase